MVWATSIAWMALVNVLIGSEFRLPLVALAGLWGLGAFAQIPENVVRHVAASAIVTAG